MAGDRGPPGRELVQDGGLQVAEDGHGDRARDGRGGHDEEVRRLLALAAQGVPLLDAEPVLFVDHDQPQIVELHLVLDQRVRADDDAGLAGDEVEQRLPPPGGPHRPGEQHDLGGVLDPAEHPALGQVAHHLHDGPVMLLGEHLGGREHGGLPTCVDDGEHGAQGHQRLSTTDLPWSSRCIGWLVARSSKISFETFSWPSVRVKGSRSSKAESRPSGAGLRGTAGSWESAWRRRARATWRTNASSHFRRARASSMSALVCGRWILRRASGSGTRPRPSRRESGSGSTASWALGRTVWIALPIFQDSSLAVAG